MKKSLLLILTLFLGLSSFAQPDAGWEVYHSGYAEESRGISYFGILNSTSEDVAWSIAYDGSGNSADISAVAYTNDGGVTWTAYDPVTLPGAVNPGISMVHPVDANTAYIAAYKRSFGNGGVWKTTDAGATWTKSTASNQFADAASFCNLVYFFDANNGFTQGDPINGEFEMYYSTDAGATWTPIPGSDIDDPLAGEYGYTHGYAVAGNTFWFTTNKGRLYRSTDNGQTWTAFQTPLTDFGGTNDNGSVTFKDDNEGWIVRGNGELYHSTDGGETWTLMTPTYDWSPDQFFGGDVAFIPGTTNTLVVTEADSNLNTYGSAISEDGGANWAKIVNYNFNGGPWEVLQPDGNIQHVSVGFRDTNFGLSGGFSHQDDPADPDDFVQGVFKYVPNATSIAGEKIEGLRIYPNPATDVVYITTENAPVKNISIFDITGKEVINLNSLSLNNTSINVSNLKQGMYLMKIEDENNNQQAVKLVIK